MPSSSSSTMVAWTPNKTIHTSALMAPVTKIGSVYAYVIVRVFGFGGFLVTFLGLLQKNTTVVSIDGFEDVRSYDEKALKKAVAHQPVSVAIEASGMPWQFYQSVS